MSGGAILPLEETSIYYASQGSATGTPYLLIHGWCADQTDWAFQTTFLVLLQLFQVVTMARLRPQHLVSRMPFGHDVRYGLVPRLEEDFDEAVAAWFEPGAAHTPETPDYRKEWHRLRSWAADEEAMIAAWIRMSDTQGPSGANYSKAKKVAGIPRLVFSNTEAGREVEEAAGSDPEFDRVQVMRVGHWIMQAVAEKFTQELEQWIRSWE